MRAQVQTSTIPYQGFTNGARNAMSKSSGREKRESGRAEEITNDAEVYKADGRDRAAWRLGCCSEWTTRKWPCPGSRNHNRFRWRAFSGTGREGLSGRPQTYRR